MNELQRTPLFSRHLRAGARLAPFAGWEMPLQYEGIRAEHLATREGVGLFDVSHMGQIETRGPDALRLLQRLLSNDVGRMSVGGAQYSLLCNWEGGVLDDLFSYRLEENRYLTITNSANHRRDLEWFRRHSTGLDVDLFDRQADWAMVAVQGPGARAALGGITEGELPARMRAAELRVAGSRCLVCGTGYTGEDGCELLMDPADAGRIWDALIAAGGRPAGLGARDTLRLEVCYHLYGNDLSEDRNPLEAGLGWCSRPETAFIGADALARVQPDQMLVPFVFLSEGIPRAGNEIRTDAGPGVVTSGTLSPSLGIGIGMGYVPRDAAAPGTGIEVDVRGTVRAAEVRNRPLYSKEDHR